MAIKKNMTPKEVGKHISAVMHVNNVDEYQLAKKTGFHPRTISDMIKGQKAASNKAYSKVAKALNTTFELSFPLEQE